MVTKTRGCTTSKKSVSKKSVISISRRIILCLCRSLARSLALAFALSLSRARSLSWYESQGESYYVSPVRSLARLLSLSLSLSRARALSRDINLKAYAESILPAKSLSRASSTAILALCPAGISLSAEAIEIECLWSLKWSKGESEVEH
jgi:hypothetical protein